MADDEATRHENRWQRVRRLRRHATKAERLLWLALRNRGVAGLKFRRQHAIGIYVVDFYCHESQLIVEIDGESHEGRQRHDRRRQEYLERQGFQVLRVTNEDVLTNLEGVAIAIARAAGIDVQQLFVSRPSSPPEASR